MATRPPLPRLLAVLAVVAAACSVLVAVDALSRSPLRMALGGNFNIGGNRRRPPEQGGAGSGGGGGGVPKVVSINQPQDLLDFVIQDERLSVVKVYASWCKTCAVFDLRYRKLAAQLGDTAPTPAKGAAVTRPGLVRFAEMKYDDPNNEEMCKLLNATKLPYILMYKGSQGKVADFQCGPAKFQRLLDAVSEYADAGPPAAEEGVPAAGGGGAAERDWKPRQERGRGQGDARYGAPPVPASGNGGRSGNGIVDYPSNTDGAKLERKEKELVRLYSELAALRADFDRRVTSLKETHAAETGALEDRLREQTVAFDHERRALSKQIEGLSREMMDREKSLLEETNAAAQTQEANRKEKEEEYKKNLTELNVRIGELQRDLLKSRNELQYGAEASAKDQQRLQQHVAQLESEIAGLASRNTGLEAELIEEKRLVVASAEEAARVLGQLNAIKGSEDEERDVLRARIRELEDRIELRERQLLDVAAADAAAGDDAAALRELERELARLQEEHGTERARADARIADLEAELARSRGDRGASAERLDSQRREQDALREDAAELASRILALEDEIDERDKLLRTSNKATDILLDNMEAQKREYEAEMERTGGLVEELEAAIEGREREFGELQSRMEGLERNLRIMTATTTSGGGSAVVGSEENQPQSNSNANQFRQQQQEQQQQQSQANENGMDGSLDQERRARVAAEQEVGKLMGYLQDREEEISRMQQQGGAGAGTTAEAPGWFGEFGALFNSGSGNENTAEAGGGGAGWGSPWGQGESSNSEEEQEIENYELLKDVLMPSEGTFPLREEPQTDPRYDGAGRSDNVWQGAAPPSDVTAGDNAAGRSENVWEGAGLSSLMSEPAGNNDGGRSGAFLQGLQQTPSPSPAANVPSAAPAELPSPAMAFERRLAENPIVPAGAFGGSKPTSSFFSPRSSTQAAAPSETPEYYQTVIDGFNDGRQGRREEGPTAAYEQRPTAPAPRGAPASRRAENIYAGAGSFGGAAQTPSPVPREPPVAPQPTPAMEFERRLAENPIVPAGTFGGKAPTAHFFRPKADLPPASSSGGGETNYGAAAAGGGGDASQSKWQRLDDNEKKRVAEEAYKAFEKSLEDRRVTAAQPKQKMKGGIGRGAGERGGRSEGATTKRPSTTTATAAVEPAKKQSSSISQAELERRKHQAMVKASAAAAPTKGQSNDKTSASRKIITDPKNTSLQPQQQSAQQIQATAAQASAKRMSLAERAAKAERDQKETEIRRKAESRKSQEAKQLELQRAKEIKQANDFQRSESEEAEQRELQRATEQKRNEDIQRAEELKRKAEANLALAAQAKAKADAEAAKQQQQSRSAAEQQTVKDDGDGIATQQGWVEPTSGISLDKTEIIDAALLGAEEGEEARSWKVPISDPALAASASKKRQQREEQKRAKTQKKVAVAAGSGFAVGKQKYDVMVLKDPKNTQLLEGSLKDLLKDQEPPPKRNSGNLNY